MSRNLARRGFEVWTKVSVFRFQVSGRRNTKADMNANRRMSNKEFRISK
jgi:hypothetical protein